MTLSAAISDGQGAAVVVDDAEVGVRNRRGGFFTKNQILSVQSSTGPFGATTPFGGFAHDISPESLD